MRNVFEEKLSGPDGFIAQQERLIGGVLKLISELEIRHRDTSAARQLLARLCSGRDLLEILQTELKPGPDLGPEDQRSHIAATPCVKTFPLLLLDATFRVHPMQLAFAGHRIMVVEDEPLVAEDIAETLIAFGATVDFAFTLDQALALDLRLYSAGVVNYKLGDYDCTSFCEKLIRARVPYIICSGRPPADGRCLEAVYITKPADPTKLLSALQSIIGSRPTSAEALRISAS